MDLSDSLKSVKRGSPPSPAPPQGILDQDGLWGGCGAAGVRLQYCEGALAKPQEVPEVVDA